MLPTNRAQLKLFCLRKLGHPVIPIDMADEQVEDRIDEALDLFQTWHYDGTEKVYTSIATTPALIANNTGGNGAGVLMPNTQSGGSIFSVTRIFTLAGSSTNSAGTGGFNMFDINYQIRLNELYDYTAGDYTYFELANEHLRILEMLFTGEIPIRYNRYNNILYIDCDWAVRFSPGMFIIAECYATLANTATFWQDPWLIDYTTCLIKQNWGESIKKFGSVQLPGGMILNGQRIYDEATAEKIKLQDDLHRLYQEPAFLDSFVG